MESCESSRFLVKNININGAKNAALPILAATLLKKNIYYIRNIPLISDIDTQITILKQFNVRINYINKTNLIIDTTDMVIPDIIDYSKNTRGTYYFIGSTVIYNKDLEYILETGCKIDVRAIDFHIKLLELLGKTVVITNNKLFVTGKCIDTDLTYTFPKPSIGSTINALFMYSHCKSKITLNNYAKDPYIINTIEFLIKIGFHIEYNDVCIVIDGSKTNFLEKKMIDHSIIYDPIESLTYIIYSGICLEENNISNYTIGPIHIKNLGNAYSLLEEIGIFLVESNVKNLYHIKKTVLKPFQTATDYFPKIYTDIQPFLTLLALFIKDGVTTIKEQIWCDRFKYIYEFNKLGYNIVENDNQIIINSSIQPKTLVILDQNIDVSCTDLRGGMAILLLLRKNGINKDPLKKYYIDRGYSNYEENIRIINETKNENDKYGIFYNIDTKSLSNIKIGGIAKYYVEAFSEEDIKNLINYCIKEKHKYKLIGDGNNIYFSDFYDGMIIKNMHKNISQISDNCFIVSSGMSLIDFIIYIADFGYDLSSLVGIPGSIGGAIYGNAGAYGLEICELIESCSVISTKTGLDRVIDKEEMDFQYRSSVLKKTNCNIILSAKIKFDFPKSDITKIMEKITKIITTRNIRIPMENTLGSIFKNTEKKYAWKILDELELRGKTIHNITMHENHPNIFINNNNASSEDFNTLLKEISGMVFIKYGKEIEKEIEFI